MTLDALVILAGSLVAFLAVAGFPPSIYKPLFFILGIFTVILGIVVRRKRGAWESAVRAAGHEPRPARDASPRPSMDGVSARHDEEALV